MASSPPTPLLTAAAIITSTAVATLSLLALARLALDPRHPQTLRSPLRTVIPTLTAAELSQLDYAPDAFPGARDVATPYGSVRAYEFGPAAGDKVLLLHGISTSCQTLAHVARRLAASGRRVLLFDLFGRGFSDSPSDLPHDARLYVAQALMVMASSPLAWTGEAARVKVVGYSMGGGVAAHLVAAFPGGVESLVLLAPAGLIRYEKFGRVANWVFRSGMVPERVLAVLTRRRLQRPIASGAKGRGEGQSGKGGEEEPLVGGSEERGPVGVALAEAADGDAGKPAMRLEVRVLRYVQWAVKHHPGFVPAFMGSIRDAPLMGQHETYKKLGETKVPVAVVFGRKDTVVDEKGYREDGCMELLGGEQRVTWKAVDGGHDFPMTHAEEVVEIMEDFWKGIGA